MKSKSPATRWGIIATGNIANKFAHALHNLPDNELVAVASRSEQSAKLFASKHNNIRYYGSYESLIHIDDIDVIYIATPHPMHHELTMQCLNAGKPVLCEKPFSVNAVQAADTIEYARTNSLFLMEALWTRFIPVVEHVKSVIKAGEIGKPHLLSASLGFQPAYNPGSRIFSPELAGGAMLDVGIYAIHWSFLIFGKPDHVSSMPVFGETGVDETSAILCGYNTGQIATLLSTIRVKPHQGVVIVGSKGEIILEGPAFNPDRMIVKLNDDTSREIDISYEGHGLAFEAMEVSRCLRDGLTESNVLPLNETLEIMKTMDKIRKQWGLKYPCE